MSDVGAEKTSSPINSATRAINDAWEFLFPAATQAALTIGIAVFIGGWDSVVHIWQRITTSLASIDVRGTSTALDQYKLTPLVPVAALFLIAVLVYVYNRIVMVVAALLPFRMAWSSARLLGQIPAAEKLWARVPGVGDLTGLDRVITATLVKARAESKGALLTGVDYWEREFSKGFKYVSYAKFAIVWAVVCALLIRQRALPIRHISARLGLILLGCMVTIFIAFVRCAYATKQAAFEKVSVADGILATAGALPSNAEAGEKFRMEVAMDTETGRGWWWINIAPFDWHLWFATLRDFDPVAVIPFQRARNLLVQRRFRRKHRNPVKMTAAFEKSTQSKTTDPQ